MSEEDRPLVNLKPLILEWLTKWKNDVSRFGSKMEFVYKNAMRSLKETTDPVFTIQDVRKIKFFGDKLTDRIHQQLKQHCQETGMRFPGTLEEELPSSQSSITTKKSVKQVDPNKPKRTRKTSYVPKPHSGGFAILVGLYVADRSGIDSLCKSELQERAQEYCSESMTKSKTGSHYTAWSSMKTLISNGMVDVEQKRNAYYSLTDDGRELARKLTAYLEKQDIHPSNQVHDNDSLVSSNQAKTQRSSSQSSTYRPPFNSIFEYSNDDDSDIECLPLTCDGSSSQKANGICSQSSTFSSASQLSSQISSQLTSSSRFCLKPGSFDIVLLVDTREQASGVSSDLKKTAIISEFIKHDIKAEMRTLPAGDFTWIAKEKSSSNGLSNGIFSRSGELVLDVVIERKRVDDLASSIQDGRFHEQKHRLKKSGVRRPTYLVENLTPGSGCSVPYRGLLTAVTNSQVIDGFSIKCTNSNSETMMYLACMTNYLKKQFGNKCLFSCSHEETQNPETVLPDDHFITFNEFEKSSRKITNFSVKEMFLKHLLQFRGLSVVKAKAITDVYPTIKDLLSAYEACSSEKERENLLSQIKSQGMNKAVGPVASKKVYRFYTFQAKKTEKSPALMTLEEDEEDSV